MPDEAEKGERKAARAAIKEAIGIISGDGEAEAEGSAERAGGDRRSAKSSKRKPIPPAPGR